MTKEEFESQYGLSYDEMLDQYSEEYLNEMSGGERVVEPMDYLEDWLANMDGYDAFTAGLYAHRYDGKDDWEGHSIDFSLNDEWFSVDAYGHYVSMNDREKMEWLNDSIDDNYFIDWLIENGYVEGGEIEE